MFNKKRNTYQEEFLNQTQNSYETERLLYEIRENRRRINNLCKRVIRLENYLRIKDQQDYSIIDDEDPMSPFN